MAVQLRVGFTWNEAVDRQRRTRALCLAGSSGAPHGGSRVRVRFAHREGGLGPIWGSAGSPRRAVRAPHEPDSRCRPQERPATGGRASGSAGVSGRVATPSATDRTGVHGADERPLSSCRWSGPAGGRHGDRPALRELCVRQCATPFHVKQRQALPRASRLRWPRSSREDATDGAAVAMVGSVMSARMPNGLSGRRQAGVQLVDSTHRAGAGSPDVAAGPKALLGRRLTVEA